MVRLYKSQWKRVFFSISKDLTHLLFYCISHRSQPGWDVLLTSKAWLASFGPQLVHKMFCKFVVSYAEELRCRDSSSSLSVLLVHLIARIITVIVVSAACMGLLKKLAYRNKGSCGCMGSHLELVFLHRDSGAQLPGCLNTVTTPRHSACFFGSTSQHGSQRIPSNVTSRSVYLKAAC